MTTKKLFPRVAIITFVSLLLFGCAEKTTVILLSDPDGKVGHVTVSNEAGSVDITRLLEATEVSDQQSLPSAPKIRQEDEIIAEYSAVLSALPQQPKHFILYFLKGSTKLTDLSKGKLPEILTAIKDRKSQNISVIGHSDTAGNRHYNLRLSGKRAQTVLRILLQKGVKESYVKSTSHGEENPLVKTADNVNEPKNRRVEVVVR